MTRVAYTRGTYGLALLIGGGVSLAAQRGLQQRGETFVSMSGTYALDATRGDDARRAAAAATWSVPPARRDRVYQRLLGRRQPLAIERNGRMVTISSSNGPRTTFEADGLDRHEPGPAGGVILTRAEIVGDVLSISTHGDRNTDFLVTFEPIENGDGLLVTRQMDSTDLAEPIAVRSYYGRVDAQPRWDVYVPDSRGGAYPEPRVFAVPDGTRLLAVLDTSLSTRTSRSGQHFSMTVQSPREYAGARIDGVIARITPHGPGRNVDLRVDFDRIRLRGGRPAEFDAILDTVRTPGGMTLRVEAGGDAPDAVQQGAIGAALGTVIGAIVGGGKGAVVGAVVGGASGAIMAQDRDPYLELPPNTQVGIVVTTSGDRTR